MLRVAIANDFSSDAAVVAEFIGEEEYRRSFLRLGESLNLKGSVTPFDDALFALELQLLNLERMRERSTKRPNECPGLCSACAQKEKEGLHFIPVMVQHFSAIQMSRNINSKASS
jgi:hypothetical protein